MTQDYSRGMAAIALMFSALIMTTFVTSLI